MDYRPLGDSDLKVSALCLGTMTWGQQNTEADGHAQMDYAVGEGINFLDAAEIYPIPPRAETQGATERIIGSWMAARKNRARLILATKVAGRSAMTWLRADGSPTRLVRAQMEEALDASLKRLRTDYVDLYQLHWPDRPIRLFGGHRSYKYRPSDSTPLQEILQVLADMQKSGKIRHIGLSNETAWGIMACLHHAKAHDLPRIVSVQNAYNLLNRCYEQDNAEMFHEEGVGLLAYSPLAQGYLTGKYQNGALPPGSRKALFQRLSRYETPGSDKAIDRYLEVAKAHGLNPAQMALQFVTTRSFVTSNIIGATSMEQLKIAVESVKLNLSDEVMKAIDDAHAQAPNLCP